MTAAPSWVFLLGNPRALLMGQGVGKRSTLDISPVLPRRQLWASRQCWPWAGQRMCPEPPRGQWYRGCPCCRCRMADHPRPGEEEGWVWVMEGSRVTEPGSPLSVSSCLAMSRGELPGSSWPGCPGYTAAWPHPHPHAADDFGVWETLSGAQPGVCSWHTQGSLMSEQCRLLTGAWRPLACLVRPEATAGS